jgi:curved DNA-binding protein CbpA
MSAPPDPYKILQVDSEAEDEVIVGAYRRLARKYHPDVAVNAEAAARMSAINAAWEVIGEPARRAAYDRQRQVEAALARSAAEATARQGSTGPGPASTSSTASPPQGRPSSAGPSGSGGAAGARTPPREPETVSRDWSSGRSTVGGGYDPSMHKADGHGAAGTPPGNPSGSVLNFGRYAAWSLGEVARADLEYLEWLDRMPIGRPYRDEIDAILRRTGRRRSAEAETTDRRGLFRRR